MSPNTYEKDELIRAIRAVMEAGPFCTLEDLCQWIRRDTDYKPYPPNISNALGGDPRHEYLLSAIADQVLGGPWTCEKHKTWTRN